MNVYFSDVFNAPTEKLEEYGAFNISIVTDFPLFVDPFLLFNSQVPTYQNLHGDIIQYLKFLRDKAVGQTLTDGLILAWYKFPEVKQNWMGFTEESNQGRGLGPKFARALHRNLNNIFNSFGKETVTRGSHLEKLCLIDDGVGRDMISDFTANLIKGFLANYTSIFAQKHIAPELRKKFSVARVKFNYTTEVWESGVFDLPHFDSDFVLLTPKDVLTKDDIWINKSGLYQGFEDIPNAIPNGQLRAQVNNYFYSILPKEPKKDERENAIASVIAKFPELIDYYIKSKEENGDRAVDISAEKVAFSNGLYVEQFSKLGEILAKTTSFYKVPGNTYDEAMEKVLYLKQVPATTTSHRHRRRTRNRTCRPCSPAISFHAVARLFSSIFERAAFPVVSAIGAFSRILIGS